ncbi:MAG: SigE family RNA polymerase sigma factor [Actinobacteria bacterium]|nr:SigE family RNA polymerase sigma factor [Actinomycetota bacterium]
MGGPQDDDSFEAFVAEHGAGLLAFAHALSGNRQDAEDLTQAALAAAYARWPRIRPDTALAYLRRSIANGRVSLWRRPWQRDVRADLVDLPVTGSHDVTADRTADRLATYQALRALPRGQRAVLVLRYLHDLPDDEVAAALGIGAAGVRSQAHRGLAALRRSLQDDDRDSTSQASTTGPGAASAPGRAPSPRRSR